MATPSPRELFERAYKEKFLLRGVDTKHMSDCELMYHAGFAAGNRAGAKVGGAAKQTIEQQIAQAKREVASWPPGKLDDMRLQGSPMPDNGGPE